MPTATSRLTAAGRKIARKLTLRHHLIERMLSELFGMEWWKVHDEAERLEHAVSPDFEAKLLAKLGRERRLPARQPQRTGKPRQPPPPRTASCSPMPIPAHTYSVSGIYERDRHLLEFLEARGIRPGAKLRLLERNYDKTLTPLAPAAGKVSLGRAAAERVWVSPLRPA